MAYSKGLALILMLVIIVAHMSPGEAWWGRRRRRRCHTPHKPAGKHWANDWDRQLHFECRRAQSISNLYSIYSTCHRDRVWAFKCHHNPVATECRWTYNANQYDRVLNFHCAYGFISGIRSVHSNHHEDRVWSFKCCSNRHYVRYGCITTNYYQNSWRGTVNYYVPHGYYLSGATSVHNNGQEDRRWQFEYCKFKIRIGRDAATGNDAEKEDDRYPDDPNAENLNPEANVERERAEKENMADEELEPNVADAENLNPETNVEQERADEEFEPNVADAENLNPETNVEQEKAEEENTADDELEPNVAADEREDTEEDVTNPEMK